MPWNIIKLFSSHLLHFISFHHLYTERWIWAKLKCTELTLNSRLTNNTKTNNQVLPFISFTHQKLLFRASEFILKITTKQLQTLPFIQILWIPKWISNHETSYNYSRFWDNKIIMIIHEVSSYRHNLIQWETNYSIFLVQNFGINLQFHTWNNYRVLYVSMPRWRQSFKMLWLHEDVRALKDTQETLNTQKSTSRRIPSGTVYLVKSFWKLGA